jgi:hypothetical protein
MKKLNYIKLFEAFDSRVLSKTLGYISDKESFLNLIKKVVEPLDYPVSKLNDDFFEYLGFNKALKKADILTDEPCEATSASEFPDYTVEGASCKGGLLKRTWGRTIRSVVCPVCNGTGVKPKRPGDIKMLKFWFNKEGKFITTTAVDGIVRDSKGGNKRLSDRLDNYNIGKSLTKDQIMNLPHGSYALLSINDRDTISYIFKKYNDVFALQYHHSGADPGRSDWKSIAPYSWQLGSFDHGDGKLLTLKEKNELVSDVNPYSWNVCINTSYYRGLSINTTKSVEDGIKDAHFAIVLDLSKLKKSEYVKRTKTREDRLEFKKGAAALLSNEEVKKQNISRYLDKISTNIDIIDDVSNLPKLVKRMIGYKYVLFLVTGSSNIKDNLSNIISIYYDILSNDNKDYNINRINGYVEASLRKGIESMNRCSSNFSELNKMIEDERYVKEKELIKFLMEISEILYKNISDMEIETIEDLEILYQKLMSVRNIFTSSRYIMSKCSSFIGSMVGDGDANRSFVYLTDNWYIQDNIYRILSERERIRKIISKI